MAYEVKIVSVREQAVKKIRENKIIAIFRNIEVDKCVDAAKALYAGGIRVVEVTFNQKEADEQHCREHKTDFTGDGWRYVRRGRDGADAGRSPSGL